MAPEEDMCNGEARGIETRVGNVSNGECQQHGRESDSFGSVSDVAGSRGQRERTLILHQVLECVGEVEGASVRDSTQGAGSGSASTQG